MKTLLIPEARMMFVSLDTDAAPTHALQTLDDWITRVKARGHALLEENSGNFTLSASAPLRTYGAATGCTATASKWRGKSTALKRSKKPAAGE